MKKLLFLVTLYCTSMFASANSLKEFEQFYAITPEQSTSASATLQINSLNLGKPLLIYNGDAKKNLIHINSINEVGEINTEIKILGHPADLIISNEKRMFCSNCSFENAKRISLVNGRYSNGKINTHALRPINTHGFIVGKIYAPGAQSLEIYTHKLLTNSSSTVDINLKAFSHKGEYLVMDKNGDVEVGTGGISFYVGNYTVEYESGKILKNDFGPFDEHDLLRIYGPVPTLNINGNYKSAGFSIASSMSIEVSSGTKIDTVTSALSSSNSDKGIYVPNEGVSISNVGFTKISPRGGSPFNWYKFYQPHILNNGTILSDKKVEMASWSSFKNTGVILSGKTSLFASSGVFNTGNIEAYDLEVSGGSFANEQSINANTMVVETGGNIVNAYGGIIRSKVLTLKSRNGLVANGVRRSGQNITSSWELLDLEKDHEKLNQGIYHQVKNKIAYKAKPDLSAKIFASRISVSAKAFENINPYSLSKGANDWSASIKVSSSRSNSVIFQAENNLEIDVENYILNSSAILSLSQSGTFDINAKKVFNERYRLDVDTAYYSGFSVTNDSKTQIYASERGNKSKVVNYSPPGRIIVFGKLRVSDGTRNPRSTQEFNNLFSYVEVFSKAYFNNLRLTSVGLQLTSDTYAATYADTKYCQSTGRCGSEVIETYVEAETLLSFHGGVYGVKEDLPSSADLDLKNVDGLAADKAAAGKEYMASLEYDHGIDDSATVTSYSISGDILTFWLSTCRKVLIPYTDDSFRTDCGSKKHTVDLDKLLTNSNKDEVVDDTGLTIAQIEARLDKYISGLKNNVSPTPPYDTWLPTTAYKTAYQITANDTMIEFGYKVSGYMTIHDTQTPTVAKCKDGTDEWCRQVTMSKSGKILISKLPK
ncbi:hypothetical protein [Pseudoalteromonas luteoviolacea]|uniref:Uncharacterized protein n=1 Tax=Pseudoalteromonas luteoviolacea S4060-1 TaxID=1365257 RepID=A0A161YI90_9GAMM|nr:hypothetical protein [Pseudoalteromonas luteoviolacea]KZN60846.1 hypothetical protein N478_25920 [Pseudoalteromonas luteoviolacea S4060-1]